MACSKKGQYNKKVISVKFWSKPHWTDSTQMLHVRAISTIRQICQFVIALSVCVAPFCTVFELSDDEKYRNFEILVWLLKIIDIVPFSSPRFHYVPVGVTVTMATSCIVSRYVYIKERIVLREIHLRTTRRHLSMGSPGLPWGLNFNAHTHPIPTEKPVGIPISTESRNPPYPYPTPCIFLFDAYIILFFYHVCHLYVVSQYVLSTVLRDA